MGIHGHSLLTGQQPRGRGGGLSVCNVPATSLDGPSSNLQNIKHKHADQPAKKRVTPYRFHVSPLLILRGGKQIIFKNVCNMQDVLCNVT
jgi:hypothetical protein